MARHLLLLLGCSLALTSAQQNFTLPALSSSAQFSTTIPPVPTTATPTTSSQAGGTGLDTSWAANWNNFLKRLANSGKPSNGSSSLPLLNMLQNLPGVLQGLGALNAIGQNSGNGSDVANVLAQLFANPNVVGLPSWLEKLAGGGSSGSSQMLKNLTQFVQQLQNSPVGNSSNLVQGFLSQVFRNVSQGLASLRLTDASSIQDIMKAILNDDGLLSSLPSSARQILSEVAPLLGFSSDWQALAQQFPTDPNSRCGKDLMAFAAGLQSRQFWALKMLDAMGKPPAGILTGDTLMPGNYEECVSISQEQKQRTIEGKMCGMALPVPAMLGGGQANMFSGPPTIGMTVCVPRSCSDVDVYNLFAPTASALQTKIYGVDCNYDRSDPKGDPRFLGVMIVLGILVSLCAAGTAFGVFVDNCKEKQKRCLQKDTLPLSQSNGHLNGGYVVSAGDDVKGKLTNGVAANGNGVMAHSNGVYHVEQGHVNGDAFATKNMDNEVSSKASGSCTDYDKCLPSQLLLSFSVLRNGRKILSCAPTGSDIACLHGIRVLSIVWVVFGHVMSQSGAAISNKTYMVDMFERFTYMALPGALLAVDTFFLLSGCLSAFLFLRASQKSGLNISGVVLYYVHRYWRLTPLYGLLIAVYVGVFPYLKEGPFKNTFGLDSESPCRDYWWRNILYVNNVVGVKLEEMCFGWSWYLANDMQFSYLAPVILIPWALKGRAQRAGKAIGCVLVLGLILTHCIASGVISYTNDVNMINNVLDYFKLIYFAPWCRVGPYAVGLALGYILFKTKCKYTMDKMSVFLGWTLAWAVGLTLVYVELDNLHDLAKGLQWGTAGVAAYESVAKVAWAVCVAWVIFACATGYGGFVNTLLSWSAWAPLSRLTYGVYLIHLIVISVLSANMKTPLYMDGYIGTELTIAVTALSYMSAFVFTMLIEAPTLGLEKAVLGRLLHRNK